MTRLLPAAAVVAVLAVTGCSGSGSGSANRTSPPAKPTNTPTTAATTPAPADGLASSACHVSTADVVALMGPVAAVADKQVGPSHVCTWTGKQSDKPAVLAFVVSVGPAAAYEQLAPHASDHPQQVAGFDQAQAWVVNSFGQYTGYLIAKQGDRSVFLDLGTLTEPTVSALGAIAHAALS